MLSLNNFTKPNNFAFYFDVEKPLIYNKVKLYFEYRQGGYNFDTYKKDSKGLYACVVPVRDDGSNEKFNKKEEMSICIKSLDEKPTESEMIEIINEYSKRHVENMLATMHTADLRFTDKHIKYFGVEFELL